jgi:hypothetical protein
MKSFLAGDRGGIPPGVFQSKLPIFNALGAGFCRNSFVLRNLEAKFLKTRNLRGVVWEGGTERDVRDGKLQGSFFHGLFVHGGFSYE